MAQCYEVVTDGCFNTGNKDPPGQASVYIPPGDIRNEEYRLATFKSFPKDSPVHRADLSSSGFHYVGYKDRVKCFCCGATVDTWMIGDNPRESKWHKTDCDFANQRDTQNIAMRNESGLLRRLLAEVMAQSANQIPITQPKSPDVRQTSATNHQHPIMPDPQLRDRGAANAARLQEQEHSSCQNPVNPHMRSLVSRIETFRARSGSYWPAHKVRTTVNELAVAGFFFLGERDRVKCWYCNGGIQNWEYDDDPWIEHAKWFPNCEFVRAMKGATFVQQIVAQYPDIVRPLPLPQAPVLKGTNSQHTVSNVPNASPESNVMTAVQQAMLRLNYVTKAKAMGIDIDVITQVLASKYEKDGEFYLRDQDFFDAVFSIRSHPNESSIPSPTSNEDNRNGHEKSPMHNSEIETRNSEISTPQQLSRETGSNTDVGELASQLRSLTESRLCKICKENKSNVVTIPCGHICTCDKCVGSLSKCPSCHTKISQIIKTFRA